MNDSAAKPRRPKAVQRIGEEVAYADGAERELLDLITAATDISCRSDELAQLIHDWPTRYHLSRLRSNLLRPLRIPAATRVLDVGAGTGAIARYLGERGAAVTALEGSPDRAQVAAARCRDLESVEVLAGDFAELDVGRTFDLVVVVGVLEYAAAATLNNEGAAEFLERCRSFLGPDGAVILAIENQIGLKYLLGHPEDHEAEPGVGLEGYPGGSVARTFTRKRLAELLVDAGLPQQQWLFPFPDYKLPTTVLSEAAYQDSEVLDRLVRDPVRILDAAVEVLVDARRAHRTFVEAGLGPDVANSFLVVAALEGTALDRWLDPNAVAWLLGDERRTQWMRDRIARAEASTTTLEADRSDEPVQDSWLTQHVDASVPFIFGPSLEQLVLEGCAREESDDVDAVLNRWRDLLSTHSVESEPGDPESPWAPSLDESALPGRFLDVNLDNFIVGPDDAIVFVDQEWETSGPVAARLVQYRALWYLAVRLITTGVVHPWPAAITVDELAAELAGRLGLEVTGDLSARWRIAEASFQALVQGHDESSVFADLEDLGAAARLDRPGSAGLPFTALRRELRDRSAHIEELEDAATRLDVEMRHRQEVIDELAAEADRRQEVIDELAGEAQHRLEVIDGLAAEAQHRLEVIDELAAEVKHNQRIIRDQEAEAAALLTDLDALQQAVGANRLTRYLVERNQPR